jgi:hypothetical protein
METCRVLYTCWRFGQTCCFISKVNYPLKIQAVGSYDTRRNGVTFQKTVFKVIATYVSGVTFFAGRLCIPGLLSVERTTSSQHSDRCFPPLCNAQSGDRKYFYVVHLTILDTFRKSFLVGHSVNLLTYFLGCVCTWLLCPHPGGLSNYARSGFQTYTLDQQCDSS